MAKTNYSVDANRFVEVWQESESADEVAKKLRMPKPIVHARASNYRKTGIRLKKMVRKRKSLDVAGLNALVDTIDKKQGRKKRLPVPDSIIESVVKQVIEEVTRRAKA